MLLRLKFLKKMGVDGAGVPVDCPAPKLRTTVLAGGTITAWVTWLPWWFLQLPRLPTLGSLRSSRSSPSVLQLYGPISKCVTGKSQTRTTWPWQPKVDQAVVTAVCLPEVPPRQASVNPTKAELLQSWRAMISLIARSCPAEKGYSEETVAAAVERHPDFQSLRAYLSPNAGKQLARTTIAFYGAKIQNVLTTLENDIDRIEREWKQSDPTVPDKPIPSKNSGPKVAPEVPSPDRGKTTEATGSSGGGVTAGTVNVKPSATKKH